MRVTDGFDNAGVHRADRACDAAHQPRPGKMPAALAEDSNRDFTWTYPSNNSLSLGASRRASAEHAPDLVPLR